MSRIYRRLRALVRRDRLRYRALAILDNDRVSIADVTRGRRIDRRQEVTR